MPAKDKRSAELDETGRRRQVLFVQGGGGGVHDDWDDKLVASLATELDGGYTSATREWRVVGSSRGSVSPASPVPLANRPHSVALLVGSRPKPRLLGAAASQELQLSPEPGSTTGPLGLVLRPL
jgi:hypothetical protein